MILIFGGAYQGKLAYALETFHYPKTDAYRWPAPEAVGAGTGDEAGGGETAGPMTGRAGAAGCNDDATEVTDRADSVSTAETTSAPEAAGAGAEATGASGCRGGAAGTAGLGLPAALPEQTILCGLESLVWDCCCAGVEAKDWLAARKAQWQDKILIAADVSQGLVPMDAQERAYREMNGRTLLYLAKEAEQVHRVFCGLGQRLK